MKGATKVFLILNRSYNMKEDALVLHVKEVEQSQALNLRNVGVVTVLECNRLSKECL